MRRTVTEGLLARVWQFLALIHPTAIIASAAIIEEGAIICPYTIVSDAVPVSGFVLLNNHSCLGHDTYVGDFTALSRYATPGCAVAVAAARILGLHAALVPSVFAVTGTFVSTHAELLAIAPRSSLAFAVPGRIRERIRCLGSDS